MILSAHQPAYLPWLGYFHKIAISDKFVVLDEVQFEKNSFTNRNRIKTSNGALWLSVPIKMNGHMDKTIKTMEIDNKYNWKDKHWKSIYLNYKKTQYFHHYSDFLEDVYKREWSNLVDLTEYMNKFFLSELRIKTKIYYQSNIETKEKKQELIVELCKKLNCDTFVFGKLGRSYADRSYFGKNNINIYFQEYNHPTYNQAWDDFIPNIAIIDLLFNVSKDEALDIITRENINKKTLYKLFQGGV
ncbi:WbqC family protein [Clostridium paridis]|uniref:WbqC family protein n=1 Tax=Clostridium paridis TaxID=2803863 RepID=A0A937FI35_9CLOT|nr:WbqC family protein [Clostridium paridis]MBL4933548.1 WbqC family protein [Clostridium paridis]